jgi:hypothetical protein
LNFNTQSLNIFHGKSLKQKLKEAQKYHLFELLWAPKYFGSSTEKKVELPSPNYFSLAFQPSHDSKTPSSSTPIHSSSFQSDNPIKIKDKHSYKFAKNIVY